MKNVLNKSIAFICALFMLLGSISVYAQKGGEKLYEKYGYSEDFQYDDVTIGHALKSTVPQIRMTFSATIEYSPVTFDKDQFLELFRELYDEYGSRVSAEDIAGLLLEDLKENTVNYLSFGSQKSIETSGMATGSGVVIAENGYIATNSHVVSLDEESKKEVYFSKIQEGVIEDLSLIVEEIGEYEIKFTEDEIYALYEVILEASADDMQIIDDEVKLEVCFPTADGETQASIAKVYPAEVVAEGTQEGKDGLTQDTAILKIDAENLVAMKLSETYPDSNSKIVSAGYPGAAEVIFQSAGSEASALSVTVSNGTVSRLVPIDGTKYQSIEITSTISGGNSGGPSVDSNLNVEGLNTYINSDDKRYGYMIPAEYVRELSAEFDPGQGDVSKTFMTGLQLLQNGYGPAALECFESVAESQPDTPYIQQLAEKAKNGPQNEYPAASAENRKKFIIIAAGAAALLIIVLVVVLVIKKKKKKKALAGIGSEAVPLYSGGMTPFDQTSAKNIYEASESSVPLVDYTPPTQQAYSPSAASSKVSSVGGMVTAEETYSSPAAIPSDAGLEQTMYQETIDAKAVSPNPSAAMYGVSPETTRRTTTGTGLRSTMPKPRDERSGFTGDSGKSPKHDAFTRASDLD